MNFVLFVVTVVMTASMINGCGSGSDGSGSSTLPSTTPGGEVGQVSGAGFWIDIADNTGLFDTYVFKAGSFGTNCLIDSSVTESSEVTNCVIDILETDNFFHNVKIQYNVPQDMCEYVVTSPSWHYNYSTGYGPAMVSITNNSAGDVSNCEVLEESGSFVPCSSAEEVYEVANGSVTCEYDYTSRETGPNCCLGTYIQKIHDDADDSGTVNNAEVVVSSTESWNGDAGACLGGLGKSGWPRVDEDGYPSSIIQYVAATGINATFDIPSNSQGIAQYFQFGANYYDSTNNHSHTGYSGTGSSTVPYAFDPVEDLDETSMPSGNVPYSVLCLNRAGEVKHQIDIYLREWNTYFEFLSYSTSNGVSGDPDLDGTEGGGGANDCEFEGVSNGVCNDYWDWDDLLNRAGVGGTYDESSSDAATRRLWHPNIEY